MWKESGAQHSKNGIIVDVFARSQCQLNNGFCEQCTVYIKSLRERRDGLAEFYWLFAHLEGVSACELLLIFVKGIRGP